MITLIEFDGDINNLIAKIDEAKKLAKDVESAYKEVGNVTDSVINKATKGNIDALKKQNAGYEQQLKEIKLVEKHLERLKKGVKKAHDTKTIDKYNTRITKTRTILSSMRNTAGRTFKFINNQASRSGRVFSKLGGVLSGSFAPLIAGAAIITAGKKMVEMLSSFEDASASLSSITGLTGKDLDGLKQKAVELSVTSTSSAEDVINAYELIGSKKPELLQNAEALGMVASASITLSEAMGSDVSVAAESLTSIMNQFNGTAAESERFINVLAAGSKFGAANIIKLAESTAVAGTNADKANVSLEEHVALLEQLAEKSIEGSEAGTKLRNIYLKLSATELLPKDAQDRLKRAGVNLSDLSDKSKTFSDRLKALRPIQDDANALTSVFGVENQTTAQILIDSADATDELTASITDTNIAHEQAAINTGTLSGEWSKFTHKIQGEILKSGGGVTHFLRDLVRAMSKTVDDLVSIASFLKKHVNGMIDYYSALFSSVKNFFGSIASGNFDGAFDRANSQFHTKLKENIALRKKAEEEYIQAEKALADAQVKVDEVTNNNKPRRVKPKARRTDKADAARNKRQRERERNEAIRFQKQTEKLKIDAMAKGVDKEIALETYRYNELVKQFKTHGIDTENATREHERRLYDIKIKYITDGINEEGKLDDIRLTKLHEMQLKEIANLETAISNNGTIELTRSQISEIAKLRSDANKSFLNGLTKLGREELARKEQHDINLLNLERSSYDTQEQFETDKEKKILAIRLKYAEIRLSIIEKEKGSESDAALKLRGTIDKIKGDIDAMANNRGEFSITKLIGINDSEIDSALRGAVESIKGMYDEISRAQERAADMEISKREERIASIQSEIDAKRQYLDEQVSLDQRGISSNVSKAKKEIEILKAKKAEEKKQLLDAQKEKEKIQKRQQVIDNITQATSLITASANIFKSLSILGPVGVALAAVTIAGMVGAFIASKSKVRKGIKAEKGMAGILGGRRHTDGGEYLPDLGIEAEAGEAYAIISRGGTRKHGNNFVSLARAINRGDEMNIKNVAERFTGNSAKVVNLKDYTSVLNKILDAVSEKEYILDGVTVTKKGNTTTIIRE